MSNLERLFANLINAYERDIISSFDDAVEFASMDSNVRHVYPYFNPSPSIRSEGDPNNYSERWRIDGPYAVLLDGHRVNLSELNELAIFVIFKYRNKYLLAPINKEEFNNDVYY